MDFQQKKFLEEVLDGKSPIEVLLKKSLDMSSLKIFGCACYPYLRPFNTKKFQYRTNKCAYLGFSSVHKGHTCLTTSGKVVISRHVIFNEVEFPFVTGFQIASMSSLSQAQMSSPLITLW